MLNLRQIPPIAIPGSTCFSVYAIYLSVELDFFKPESSYITRPNTPEVSTLVCTNLQGAPSTYTNIHLQRVLHQQP